MEQVVQALVPVDAADAVDAWDVIIHVKDLVQILAAEAAELVVRGALVHVLQDARAVPALVPVVVPVAPAVAELARTGVPEVVPVLVQGHVKAVQEHASVDVRLVRQLVLQPVTTVVLPQI